VVKNRVIIGFTRIYTIKVTRVDIKQYIKGLLEGSTEEIIVEVDKLPWVSIMKSIIDYIVRSLSYISLQSLEESIIGLLGDSLLR